METLIVDYSFARPDPALIKQTGYVGVARYLAPLPNNKVIDANELGRLRNAGLALVLVWETGAARAADGTLAGAQDARAADDMADRLGFPTDRPLYFAVDFDADPKMVAPYFDGIKSATTRPTGVYGHNRVVDYMMYTQRATFGWQTSAWSHGVVTGNACLYQRLVPTIGPVDGTDENVALKPDYGQWAAPGTVVTNPPAEEFMRPEQCLFSVAAPHKDHGMIVLGAHGFFEAVRVLDPDHLVFWKTLVPGPIDLDPKIWDQLVIREPGKKTT